MEHYIVWVTDNFLKDTDFMTQIDINDTGDIFFEAIMIFSFCTTFVFNRRDVNQVVKNGILDLMHNRVYNGVTSDRSDENMKLVNQWFATRYDEYYGIVDQGGDMWIRSLAKFMLTNMNSNHYYTEIDLIRMVGHIADVINNLNTSLDDYKILI